MMRSNLLMKVHLLIAAISLALLFMLFALNLDLHAYYPIILLMCLANMSLFAVGLRNRAGKSV